MRHSSDWRVFHLFRRRDALSLPLESMSRVFMKKSRLLGVAAVFAAVAIYYAATSHIEQARISTPLPGAPAASVEPAQLDQAQLLDDVRTLSSREYAGRKTGTAGNHKAQAYLQARFGALGLQRFGGGYAHAFSFRHTSIKGLVTPGRRYRTEYAAANLIGFIPGTQKPQRYLVVSAHFDHLGTRDGTIYPGADDNASGVAAMLAIAAYFKAHPPLHTVVFAAFDGEELGLQGAQAFMSALPFPRGRLAMNLNLDMVSHNDQNQIFVAGTSYTPALKALVEQAASRSTVEVMLGHDRSQLVAGNVEDWTDSSDHGPFHAAGVPFLYFGVEDHADYHAPSDTFDHINQGFFGKVAALLIDMSATLDRNLDSIR
jgi:Zn-dependent M28 family amino/carboxypeptidase